jgi:hypothetical protein
MFCRKARVSRSPFQRSISPLRLKKAWLYRHFCNLHKTLLNGQWLSSRAAESPAQSRGGNAARPEARVAPFVATGRAAFHGLLAMDHLLLLSAWTMLYVAVWLLALQRLTP